MRSFRDLQGKGVTLGRFLGRGGEGAVYSVPMRTGLVAKIYARTPDDDMGRKLGAMVQLGNEMLRSLAAWPQDLLHDESTGSVVGFLMPRVEDHRGIHALYGPINRKAEFPDATWAFLARAARNVASTVDIVHRHGHVIGDVNEGNVFVSPRATVRLIDCDSFQISHQGQTYPCRVGVPLYTPPELQGQRLETVVRTPDHDRFGLAVLVFQLLFMGRHPFAGVRPGPVDAVPTAFRERLLAFGRKAARLVVGQKLAGRTPDRAITVGMAIREGLFAFGEEAAREGWVPPPFSVRLSDVSPAVAQLFERAFGKHPAAERRRPTAAEWVEALDELESALVTCDRNRGHAHVKANGSCPWCRIEKEGGPSFFVLPPAAPKPRRLEAEPSVSIAQLRAVPADVAAPPRHREGADPRQALPSAIRLSRMIAIDLGTSYSRVAVMEGGTPLVIPNEEGATSTPSVVAFTAQGERLVGQRARQLARTEPRNAVAAVHRLMGRRLKKDEADEARRVRPHPLVQVPNGDVYIEVRDRLYSPVEISALVLAQLKRAAEERLDEPVEEATITVPTTFTASQRQAIKDAGRIAGLKVARLLNHPTAAALAYGVAGAQERCVAVCDLGGGTFDISILEMANGLFQVRATGGDASLGGEDFDQRIVDWLLTESLRQTGVDLRRDRLAVQRLKDAAEEAKCELSSASETKIVLPLISVDASGQRDVTAVLTRREYESLTNDLLDRTADLCRRCLTDANLRPDQVDEVLLVGGQSRDPRVAALVRNVFGREPNCAVNPDEAVIQGAAIQAGIIRGEVKDVTLHEVTPRALGIEAQLGTFVPVIGRNHAIPTHKSRLFGTVADNQTWVSVHVLQGESDMVAYNTSLATFQLSNLAPAPKGATQVKVSFDIDVDGIVSVSAVDQKGGRLATFHPSGGLSQQEVSRLAAQARVREAAERSKKDESAVSQLADLVSAAMEPIEARHGQLTPEERRYNLWAVAASRKARNAWDQDDVEKLVRARLQESDLGVDERDLLIKLSGLLAKTTATLRAMQGQLTTGERERVVSAIDRCRAFAEGGVDELRGTVKALERALRLLEAVQFRHGGLSFLPPPASGGGGLELGSGVAWAVAPTSKGESRKELEDLLVLKTRVAENPSDWSSIKKIGDIYARINRREDAAREYATVAGFYARDGSLLKAIAVWRQIQKINPTLDGHLHLAELYAKQGLLVEAKGQYQIAFDEYRKRGNFRDAGNALRKMAEIDPDDLKVQSMLADLYVRDGNAGKAIEVHITIAETLERKGHLPEALQVLEKALRIDPKSVKLQASAKLRAELARVHLIQKSQDKAAQVLEEASRETPNDPQVPLSKGRVDEKDHPEATDRATNATSASHDGELEERLKTRLGDPSLTAVERDWLSRLAGLVVMARNSFEALGRRLPIEEQKRVLNAIDCSRTLTEGGADEVRERVEELERSVGLLEAVRFQH